MRLSVLFAAISLAGIAGSAAGQVSAINGMTTMARYFNDRPGSNLAITNTYPALFRVFEDNPGPGGFANGHMGAFSTTGGATPYDFNYGDAFDVMTTLSFNGLTPSNVGGEAGFKFNLFGVGHFGVLPGNGEIAAFGGILPFHSFGTGLWNSSQTVTLRIIHTPGNGNGLPGGATIPSTMEYAYNLGSGWVTSGPVAFGNLEGGIPDVPGNPLFIGPGIQNNWGAGLISSDVSFTNISITVPAPGGLSVLAGLVLLGAARRRR